MNVLRLANPNIINFLGEQHYKKGVKYRVNKYCYIYNKPYYDIIYNTLTGGVVSIYPFEWENRFNGEGCDYIDHLYQEYFLVPEDFNEDAIIDLFRSKSSNFMGLPKKSYS